MLFIFIERDSNNFFYVFRANINRTIKYWEKSDASSGNQIPWWELPTFWGGDACQKISMEPLRGTNLVMAQVDFKPKTYHPKVHTWTKFQSIK